ncbi:hypothetical protein FA15DRAFT_693691 [Coprinopsis marcescibilis]|uniref:Uncharacterized protein n=1 Tax=Coprinopsis marcescibilis TaxID=230819 RepID=A0A5C3LBF7_COPMA|nr:hypothetical protein FA15DRAFT_693691 [Coprinopsis marcescibilis]
MKRLLAQVDSNGERIKDPRTRPGPPRSQQALANPETAGQATRDPRTRPPQIQQRQVEQPPALNAVRTREELEKLSRREVQALAKEHKIAANLKSTKIIDEIIKRQPPPAEVQPPAPEPSPAPAPEPSVLSMRLVYSIPIDRPVVANPTTPPPKRRRVNATPITHAADNEGLARNNEENRVHFVEEHDSNEERRSPRIRVGGPGTTPYPLHVKEESATPGLGSQTNGSNASSSNSPLQESPTLRLSTASSALRRSGAPEVETPFLPLSAPGPSSIVSQRREHESSDDDSDSSSIFGDRKAAERDARESVARGQEEAQAEKEVYREDGHAAPAASSSPLPSPATRGEGGSSQVIVRLAQEYTNQDLRHIHSKLLETGGIYDAHESVLDDADMVIKALEQDIQNAKKDIGRLAYTMSAIEATIMVPWKQTPNMSDGSHFMENERDRKRWFAWSKLKDAEAVDRFESHEELRGAFEALMRDGKQVDKENVQVQEGAEGEAKDVVEEGDHEKQGEQAEEKQEKERTPQNAAEPGGQDYWEDFTEFPSAEFRPDYGGVLSPPEKPTTSARKRLRSEFEAEEENTEGPSATIHNRTFSPGTRPKHHMMLAAARPAFPSSPLEPACTCTPQRSLRSRHDAECRIWEFTSPRFYPVSPVYSPNTGPPYPSPI